MAMKNKTDERQRSHIGVGVALGLSIGSILGLLPLEGNVGLSIGASIGFMNGLVIGLIADNLGRRPVYTLTGMASCALAGLILGVLLDRFLLTYGYPALGIWLGGGFGLVIGAVVDSKKAGQNEGQGAL